MTTLEIILSCLVVAAIWVGSSRISKLRAEIKNLEGGNEPIKK